MCIIQWHISIWHFNRTYFDEETDRIVLDNVQCAGTEHDLIECEVFDHNCVWEDNAGVACTSEPFCFKPSFSKDNCCT